MSDLDSSSYALTKTKLQKTVKKDLSEKFAPLRTEMPISWSFPWPVFRFSQQKGGPKGAQRPSDHLFVVLCVLKSHLINYSWKRCKIFHFFSFPLTFGGWIWDHFVQNFTENNSVENFEAWKSREMAEKSLWRWSLVQTLLKAQMTLFCTVFS